MWLIPHVGGDVVAPDVLEGEPAGLAVRSTVAGSVVGVVSKGGLIGKFMVGSPARMARIKGVMRAIADPSKGWQHPLSSERTGYCPRCTEPFREAARRAGRPKGLNDGWGPEFVLLLLRVQPEVREQLKSLELGVTFRVLTLRLTLVVFCELPQDGGNARPIDFADISTFRKQGSEVPFLLTTFRYRFRNYSTLDDNTCFKTA